MSNAEPKITWRPDCDDPLCGPEHDLICEPCFRALVHALLGDAGIAYLDASIKAGFPIATKQ